MQGFEGPGVMVGGGIRVRARRLFLKASTLLTCRFGLTTTCGALRLTRRWAVGTEWVCLPFGKSDAGDTQAFPRCASPVHSDRASTFDGRTVKLTSEKQWGQKYD